MRCKPFVCLVAWLILTAQAPWSLTVADAKAKGKILNREEVVALLGDSVTVERADSFVDFRFGGGGRLNASARYHNGYRGDGHGTWRIGDDGRFCAEITWPRSPDNFCRPAYRIGDEVYFFFGRDDASRVAYRVRR